MPLKRQVNGGSQININTDGDRAALVKMVDAADPSVSAPTQTSVALSAATSGQVVAAAPYRKQVRVIVHSSNNDPVYLRIGSNSAGATAGMYSLRVPGDGTSIGVVKGDMAQFAIQGYCTSAATLNVEVEA